MKSRQRIDEQWVQDIASLFDEWKCNPLDHENQNLPTVQTDAYASEELVIDFEWVYEEELTRLISKSRSLFDP